MVNPRSRLLTASHPASVPDGEVRAKFLELLGLDALPTAGSVDFDLGALDTGDDGIQSAPLTFANELGETVPCIFMRPGEGKEPLPGAGDELPAIVCIPGTSGDAEQLAHARLHRPFQHRGPLSGWARELARRGFATLAVTLRGTEARSDPEDWRQEMNCFAPWGRSQVGVKVREALQAARALAAIDGVAEDHIGATGFSLGGQAAWHMAAVDPWLAAAAPVAGGLGSVAAFIREGDLARHSSPWFIPNQLRHFDHAQLVRACICPRPLLIIAPTEDEDMPSSGVDELLSVVEPAYADAGSTDNLEVRRPDINHVYKIEHFEWVAAFFTRVLARSTPPVVSGR